MKSTMVLQSRPFPVRSSSRWATALRESSAVITVNENKNGPTWVRMTNLVRILIALQAAPALGPHAHGGEGFSSLAGGAKLEHAGPAAGCDTPQFSARSRSDALSLL